MANNEVINRSSDPMELEGVCGEVRGGKAKKFACKRGTRARGAESLGEEPRARAQELLFGPLEGKAVDLLLESICDSLGTNW